MSETTNDTDAGRVDLRTEAGIATVSFFHPKSNSMPGALLRQLAATIVRAGNDKDTRVIVIRSDGESAFCAGASFSELRAVRTEDEGKSFFMGFADLMIAMVRCPRVIVSRVHAKAVGGGVGIVAASDYVIATRDADLRLSELAVGLGPFIVGLPIQRKIGLAAFSAMAIDAEWRSAEWAHHRGLYSEIYDTAAEVDEAVKRRAGALAASNPEALEQLKKVFWSDTDDWPDQFQARAAISGKLAASEYTAKAVGRV